METERSGRVMLAAGILRYLIELWLLADCTTTVQISCKPDALQELYPQSKFLCVANPFNSAQTSILTLFRPVIIPTGTPGRKLRPLDTHFVKDMWTMTKQFTEDKRDSRFSS